MMIGEIETCHEVLKWDKRLCLTLCTNKIGIIKWYVDASYTINDDCRGHTGAMMTLGGGAITSFSQQQQIKGKTANF